MNPKSRVARFCLAQVIVGWLVGTNLADTLSYYLLTIFMSAALGGSIIAVHVSTKTQKLPLKGYLLESYKSFGFQGKNNQEVRTISG